MSASRAFPLVIALAVAVAPVAPGQRPGLTGKLKGAIKGAVDSALTKSAAAVTDSLLGTGSHLAGGCPPGFVPGPGAMTSVGTELVKQARKQIAGPDTATAVKCVPDPTGGHPAMAGDPAAQQAAMMAAQQAAMMAAQQAAINQASGIDPVQAAAAAAAAAPGAGGMGKAMAAATPIGLAATAAPSALKGAKALGLLGKGPSKEGMIEDLSRGRLELKGLRFIGASDVLKDGFDDDLTALAEALQAMEGNWVLRVPAEAADKAEPDTVVARRRIVKLEAQLATAGVPVDRIRFAILLPEGKKKAPGVGEAKLDLVKATDDQ